MVLDYPPLINNLVQEKLNQEPGLRQFFERLEKSVEGSPEQASPDVFNVSSTVRVKAKIQAKYREVKAYEEENYTPKAPTRD